MKKFFSYAFMAMLFVMFSSVFTSCASDEENLIDDNSVEQYKKDIVGKWQKSGVKEFWRFDAQGAGSVGYGEEWDEADDIYEGDDGTMKFQWDINATGLVIKEKISGGYFNIPESPFTILQLNASTLRWETNDHTQESFIRLK